MKKEKYGEVGIIKDYTKIYSVESQKWIASYIWLDKIENLTREELIELVSIYNFFTKKFVTSHSWFLKQTDEVVIKKGCLSLEKRILPALSRLYNALRRRGVLVEPEKTLSVSQALGQVREYSVL